MVCMESQEAKGWLLAELQTEIFYWRLGKKKRKNVHYFITGKTFKKIIYLHSAESTSTYSGNS